MNHSASIDSAVLSRSLDRLEEALGHSSSTRPSDYDAYVSACQARGILPCSHESFVSEYGGGRSGLRHRETRMDTGFDRGGEEVARQALRDADEIAEIWDAAMANAAMYVESHCVDGETHANVIMTMKRPKITPAPTDKAALRRDALDEARSLFADIAKEHFQRQDESEDFVNGLAYGVTVYMAAIKKLQGQPKAAGETGTCTSIESPQEEEEDPGAIRQQASAWRKVYWTLAEVSPGFHREGATGVDSAVLAICRLAAAAARRPDANEPTNEGGGA